jgi:hypothetical protein
VQLGETNRKLECALRENFVLEFIKVNIEGRILTLGDLRNWVASVYREEIEKRAEEKSNVFAAGVCGILDFVGKKLTQTEGA